MTKDLYQKVEEWLSWYHSWYDNIEITNGLQDRAVDANKIIKEFIEREDALMVALEEIANCLKTGEWYDGHDGYQRDAYTLYAGDMVEFAKDTLGKLGIR